MWLLGAICRAAALRRVCLQPATVARCCSQTRAVPLGYIGKQELPWWHRIRVKSNIGLLVLPNTSVTRFLVGGGKSRENLADGDQTMSVWLASEDGSPPSTLQSWPDIESWVRFEAASDHVAVACDVPEPSLKSIRSCAERPIIVLHVPLKTSVHLETPGNAAVRDIECDDIRLLSAEGNCTVSGVKVSNALHIAAPSHVDGAGHVEMTGTIQGTSLVANAAKSIAANRILAQDVAVAVGGLDEATSRQTNLHIESVYAQSVNLRSYGSINVPVLSGSDKCTVVANWNVNIGALRGGHISVKSVRGDIRCSLDEWQTACFTSRRKNTLVKKPFSDAMVVLDELPCLGSHNMFDYLAVKDS